MPWLVTEQEVPEIELTSAQPWSIQRSLTGVFAHLPRQQFSLLFFLDSLLSHTFTKL
jgi:hypothetical protein